MEKKEAEKLKQGIKLMQGTL